MSGSLAILVICAAAQVTAPTTITPTDNSNSRSANGVHGSLSNSGPEISGPITGAKKPNAPIDPPSASTFFNWESSHSHPLDLAPDESLLALANTAGAHVEIFDASGATLVHSKSIPVGIEPVTVRFRSATELWVVNHLSDTISVVDTTLARITRTLQTADEPCDVVFAGTPARAFVTCSRVDQIQVFALDDLDAAPVTIDLIGREPRALAVSPDGSEVYAAIFESGNRTTILSGSSVFPGGGFVADPVDDALGPHGGVNPPFNDGTQFLPALSPLLPEPPRVSLIVRKDETDTWVDDAGADWTDLVSGANAHLSDRVVGWDLYDHDLAVIDSSTLAVSYVQGLMNICMAVGVHPTTGRVHVVGTDAINHVRFEPNLNGKFLRVQHAWVDLDAGTLDITDLNPHLDYAQSTVAVELRDASLGDPRAIEFSADGTLGFVAGLGSNNVVLIDADGARVADEDPIEVGEGPTGLALTGDGTRLFVLNRFEGTVSEVDVALRTELARHAFFDPTPLAIREGRRMLYDTHLTSGTGHLSCASCHVDARWDRLAWDLGSPSGVMTSIQHQNLGGGVAAAAGVIDDLHPMKGPMVTQTLQDIIGKEPFHWRGDKDGIRDFAAAYPNLLGDDHFPTEAEMTSLEQYLATVRFTPNPFRGFDNSLPTALDMTGQESVGKFSPAGTPLPPGDANAGLALYLPPNVISGGLSCVGCHTLPIGIGPDMTWVGEFNDGHWEDIPAGAKGERHHSIVGVDPTSQRGIKVSQLRNMPDKFGMNLSAQRSLVGFGHLHDGNVDTLTRFFSFGPFDFNNDQELADMVAFMLSFSGSGLPDAPNLTNVQHPPGTPSLDTHAGVGRQVPLLETFDVGIDGLTDIATLLEHVDLGTVDLVVRGDLASESRGWHYLGSDLFQSDRAAERHTLAELIAVSESESTLWATVVPAALGSRLGVDRDEDGHFDRDEMDQGSDPADPDSMPLP